MSVKCHELITKLEQLAPKQLAEDWDNIGLLIGSPEQTIHKIIITLDVDQAVVNQAIALGADMIVAHHPVIFKGITTIRTDLPLGSMLVDLIKNGIAVYAAHTNLDSAPGGVNDILAQKFQLNDSKPLTTAYQESSCGLGRIGRLSEAVSLGDFINQVKRTLVVNSVKVAGSVNKVISQVAVCGGSGAGLIKDAIQAGADVLLTGDVKYHEAQQALAQGLAIIDAGHFATEQPVVQGVTTYLKEQARKNSWNLEIVANNTSEDVFTAY